eukprot:20168-Heterococcus_DN1.PRE.2
MSVSMQCPSRGSKASSGITLTAIAVSKAVLQHAQVDPANTAHCDCACHQDKDTRTCRVINSKQFSYCWQYCCAKLCRSKLSSC